MEWRVFFLVRDDSPPSLSRVLGLAESQFTKPDVRHDVRYVLSPDLGLKDRGRKGKLELKVRLSASSDGLEQYHKVQLAETRDDAGLVQAVLAQVARFLKGPVSAALQADITALGVPLPSFQTSQRRVQAWMGSVSAEECDLCFPGADQHRFRSWCLEGDARSIRGVLFSQNVLQHLSDSGYTGTVLVGGYGALLHTYFLATERRDAEARARLGLPLPVHPGAGRMPVVRFEPDALLHPRDPETDADQFRWPAAAPVVKFDTPRSFLEWRVFVPVLHAPPASVPTADPPAVEAVQQYCVLSERAYLRQRGDAADLFMLHMRSGAVEHWIRASLPFEQAPALLARARAQLRAWGHAADAVTPAASLRVVTVRALPLHHQEARAEDRVRSVDRLAIGGLLCDTVAITGATPEAVARAVAAEHVPIGAQVGMLQLLRTCSLDPACSRPVQVTEAAIAAADATAGGAAAASEAQAKAAASATSATAPAAVPVPDTAPGAGGPAAAPRVGAVLTGIPAPPAAQPSLQHASSLSVLAIPSATPIALDAPPVAPLAHAVSSPAAATAVAGPSAATGLRPADAPVPGPFACPQCGCAPLSELELCRHYYATHGDENAPHRCPVCAQALGRQTPCGRPPWGFSQHLRSRHEYKYLPPEPPAQICTLFAAVVCRNPLIGKVLLVHECCKQGWYLPAGRVDGREHVFDAAMRECLEEAGIRVQLTGVLSVRHDTSGAVRFYFSAVPVNPHQPLKQLPDFESLGAAWFALDEVERLHADGKVRAGATEVLELVRRVLHGTPPPAPLETVQ